MAERLGTRVESLAEPDIHFIAVSPGSNGEPSRVITSTAPEVYLSSDVGGELEHGGR